MKQLLSFLLVLLTTGLFAQTTYVSNGSSTNWSLATAWTPNGVPVVGSWPYDNVTVNHPITYTGSLTNVSTTAIVINNGGTLTVTGNFINGNWGSASVNIKSGGTFTVNGTLTESGSDSFTNAGTFNVGTYTLNGAGGNTITNTGTINVTNDFTFNVARTITSTSGTINVGGAFTTGSASAVLNLSNTVVNVTGNINITGSSTFSEVSTSITVGGNFNNTGSVSTSVGGTLHITGSINNTGSSNLNLNGATTVGGNVTGTGGTHITANLSLAVTGAISLTGSAYMNGTGTVSWGTFTTDNSGSYLGCADGTHFDTDAGSAPVVPAPISHSINLNIGCTSLPVELLYFNINGNILEWSTASEINNDYFIIEKSVDTKCWSEYSVVNGNGNSNRIINYNYTVIEGYYYRLSQIDFDATRTYFNVVYCSGKETEGKLIGVYNIFGQKVDSNYDGIQILIYSNGTVVKTFKY